MKIYILGPVNPFRGGIAALNERLAIQLINEGHETYLINFTVQYPTFLFPGKTQFTDSKPDSRLRIRRLLNSINPINWLRVGIRLKKEKPDVLIVRFWLPFMGPSTGTVCKIIKRNKHTKIIALVDNLLPHEPRVGDRQFTNYFINQTDGLIAMSQSVFNDLDLFRKNQPKLLTPHPIYDHYGKVIKKEVAIKSLNLNPAFHYILFFGFIRDYKGLDLLLQALATEKLKNKKVKLIIAGEFYSNEEKYTSLIKKLNLSDKIEMYNDYIPDKNINQFFCACDIIAQPYKSATQSGVTQVGYHFNKPMLVTNVGGLPEIIEHNKAGYVVDVNAESIANSLYDYFENNREEEMTNAVMVAKDKFKWENLTNTIFKINKLCS